MPTTHFEYRRFGFWRDHITHPLQGALLGVFTAMMRVLTIDAASAFGGFVGRTIGPQLRASQRADQNLRRAMPHLNAGARQQIIRGMWDNLGRVMGEYPHLHQIIDRGRVEFVDLAGLPELILKPQPVVFFGAHLANWELLAPFAVSLGIEMNVIYRSPNNRFADRLVRRLRSTPGLTQIRKSSAGAREAVRVIRKGGVLAELGRLRAAKRLSHWCSMDASAKVFTTRWLPVGRQTFEYQSFMTRESITSKRIGQDRLRNTAG
jgi:Kdo2-lipid IVA lauroyltransferase/acyltransferase